MSTTQQTLASETQQSPPQSANGGYEKGNSQALVPAPQKSQEQKAAPAFPPPVSLLPVELDVAVPVRQFRVRRLLALEPGQMIESQWGSGEDVPLAAGDVQLAWTEFEVVETQLAVRITRLA